MGSVIEELMEIMQGYWIWIFGIVNQDSAAHFKRVYQNDWISYEGNKIWTSAMRSPHEKKWYNYKDGRRVSKPEIHGDDHPHLYWNNNTIDIATEWVYPIKDQF